MPEPNYKRIARLIEQKIKNGDYPLGARIPPERELCEVYGVSRITLRQAMAELVSRHLLVRRQGQGTFVAEAKIDSSLLGYFSLSEALRAQGLLVATRVVGQKIVAAGEGTATELGLREGERVFKLTRLRLLDGEPFALETSELPVHRFPGLEGTDFGARSLYGVLRDDYRTPLARARETLEPVLPDQEEMRLLNVPGRAPALLLLRTTFDANDAPVECARAVIRGDRCRMLFELWADSRARANAAPLLATPVLNAT